MWHGTDHTCQYRAEQARVRIMHFRESGSAAQLQTCPFLGHWYLDYFVIPLLPNIFIREGQIVCVMGLSLEDDLVEELQVNIHGAERYTLDVEISIWLKAGVMALEWHACRSVRDDAPK